MLLNAWDGQEVKNLKELEDLVNRREGDQVHALDVGSLKHNLSMILDASLDVRDLREFHVRL